MKSPFPGMDPYLEGHLWPDFHNELASKIRRQLISRIRPKYVAHLNTYTVEDNAPEGDVGIMYPDVEVLLQNPSNVLREPAVAYGGREVAPLADEALIFVPFVSPVEVKIPVIEIRDAKHKRLITSIEILSPVNKRVPGLQPYLGKRLKLHRAGVHVIEIDLLRRGTRTVQHPKLLPCDYLAALTRGKAARTEVWPWQLRSKMPVLPVPLQAPDADVTLDLQQALNEVYEEAAYELSIDYSQEAPPPKLKEEDIVWGKSLF